MEPKKGWKAAVITLLVAVLGLLGYNAATDQNLGGGDVSINSMGYLTSKATSTGSYRGTEPVLLVSQGDIKRYAIIINNSDTDMFLFATTTDLDYTGTGAARYASGTITVLDGILLKAEQATDDQDTYTIGPDNFLYGNIYASSTAGATKKELLINYY